MARFEKRKNALRPMPFADGHEKRLRRRGDRAFPRGFDPRHYGPQVFDGINAGIEGHRVASACQRKRLARAAARLNEGARKRARVLPALILMTDDSRLANPLAAARLLPPGSAIILRHRDARARARLALALKALARLKRLTWLVAEDAELAARLGADGLHLSETNIARAAAWRVRHPSWTITVAVHSERALLAGARLGADAALLAPVFATRSHPGKAGLGPLRVRLIAARALLPVYALGGIEAANVERLAGARLAGVAAIAALVPD